MKKKCRGKTLQLRDDSGGGGGDGGGSGGDGGGKTLQLPDDR